VLEGVFALFCKLVGSKLVWLSPPLFGPIMFIPQIFIFHAKWNRYTLNFKLILLNIFAFVGLRVIEIYAILFRAIEPLLYFYR